MARRSVSQIVPTARGRLLDAMVRNDKAAFADVSREVVAGESFLMDDMRMLVDTIRHRSRPQFAADVALLYIGFRRSRHIDLRDETGRLFNHTGQLIMRDLYGYLLANDSQEAYDGLCDLLVPGTQENVGRPASIEDILMHVCLVEPIEHKAVEMGPDALERLVRALAGVFGHRAPVSDRSSYSRHLKTALKFAAQNLSAFANMRSAATSPRIDPAIHKHARSIQLLLDRGAHVFGPTRAYEFMPSMAPILDFLDRTNILMHAIDAWDPSTALPEGIRPVANVLYDAALARDRNEAESVLADLMGETISSDASDQDQDTLRDFFADADGQYAMFLELGAPHIGHASSLMGPRVQSLLAEQWRSPQSGLVQSNRISRVRQQATETIVTVLLCFRRMGLALPAELWMHIFEMLTLGDLVVRDTSRRR